MTGDIGKKRGYAHEYPESSKRASTQSRGSSMGAVSADFSSEVLGTSGPSGSSGTITKEPQFGFVDIKKLEHSARILQKNIKIIIDEAPDVQELVQMVNSGARDLDPLTYDSLKNNKLVHLSAQLKSLHESGSLDIFDEILNNKVTGHDVDIKATETGLERQFEMDKLAISSKSRSATPNPFPTDSPDDSVYEINKAEDEDGVDFGGHPDLPVIKDPHLYSRVFIHKSTINNKSYLYQSELIASHNERLEFLGDSVLNNVATIILYNRYPSAPEGELSKMRSILVNNVTLAEFSINYGFDKKLKSNINDAILRQGKQKIFADIFEAYVGALAIENDLEFGVIKDWLYKLFYSRLEQFDAEIKGTEEVNKDAKSELYSLVGTAAFHPTYQVIKTGDGASKPFKVDCVMGDEILGTGIAPGLKEAGLRAAMVALRNKPLLEKYIQLRIKTDKVSSLTTQKTQSSQSDSTPEHFIEEEVTNVRLPLTATETMEFDSDARNKLYAIVSKSLNLIPEYFCKETEHQLFEAELRINSVILAFASDISKKKAMAKAAKLVLDNPGVLNVVKKE